MIVDNFVEIVDNPRKNPWFYGFIPAEVINISLFVKQLTYTVCCHAFPSIQNGDRISIKFRQDFV